ncbi:MAG: Wzz/FepE/Etk N-terminal domain-containing protein, partial [Pirellulales bacterium]|nr:Wzz/FepE/Etk N-terminal domain-containing protein [Pirellulales bacterium]
PLRWIVPSVLIASLAVAYAFVRKPTWEAAQALVVRSEANVTSEPPGKFRQAEDMKVSQETVLEIARSRSVLEAALREVGPPADAKRPEAFPTAKDVDSSRKNVSMTAPKGAEFGTTEIFYLNVKDHDRQRAIDLNRAISTHMQKQFQDLLDLKAKSMTAELEKAVKLNRAQLRQATEKLGTLESSVGADLADLRSISKLSSGGSSLQQALTKLEDDLRTAEIAERSTGELLRMLRLAETDSEQILAMPNSLLEKVPGLARLKEGLVDAQLRTAELLGAMSKAHPSVQDAIENEREVRQHIRSELPPTIRGIEVDRRLAQIQIDSIRQQIADVRERSQRLASVRAEHAQLVAEVERHTQQVKQAESRLSEARSVEAGARAANLITLVDTPETGPRPLGPGKTTICAMGLVGGLMTGFGVLLLTVPSSVLFPRSPAAEPVESVTSNIDVSEPVRSCTPAKQSRVPTCRTKLTLAQALDQVANTSAL